MLLAAAIACLYLLDTMSLFHAPTNKRSTTFYVQRDTDAAMAVAALRNAGRLKEAALIEEIATQPQAIWLGEWNSDQTTVVSQVLSEAKGAAVVFVLYAIPHRDCGGYAAGGYATTGQYQRFVNQIAEGVRGRDAWFIVEPDALPELNDCLTESQQHTRIDLIRYASQRLSRVSSHVYLDAGDYDWQPASYMARVLVAAGINYDAGFSLNVSEYDSISQQEMYGDQLSALTDHKHFVLDTSRDGSDVPATTWCNAPHQLLGPRPTTSTNDPLVDAYLWIKSPGESDGNCGDGAPPSGDWWLSYALELAGAN